MSDKKTVLVIGFGREALAVIQCLRLIPEISLGIITSEKEMSALYSRHIKSKIIIPKMDNEQRLVETIIQAIRSTGSDILIPVDEKAGSLLIRYQDVLSNEVLLPKLPELDAFNLVNDKWLMSKFMVDKNIPTPKTILCTYNEEFELKLSQMKFPVIAKPATGSGGIGISRFHTDYDLLNFLKTDTVKNTKYIVQEFIKGYSIDCSVFCKNGKIVAHTIQTPLKTRKDSYTYAKSIEFINNPKVLKITENLIAELRWSGVAHIDMQYNPQEDELLCLELNPRFWGTLRGSLAVGINFPEIVCLDALGIKIPEQSYQCERFYDKWDAVKLWVRKLFRQGDETPDFKRTIWHFMIDDPFPYVMNKINNLFKKLQ